VYPDNSLTAVPIPVRHVIYLHGFASSPRSSKAERFGLELARHGVGFTCPDLNQPEFETLTVTRMLGDARRAIEAVPEGPLALVGSSLGGFVAVHAAEAIWGDAVDRLILLAPALDFGGNRLRQLGEHGIDEWRRVGHLDVFHHADGVQRSIGFGLYEDAVAYDAHTARRAVPTLVYQGRHDDTVAPEGVARWAADRPHVDLRLIDDGHQLTLSMDEIWRTSERFLGLADD
jgi:uncharacterized protein